MKKQFLSFLCVLGLGLSTNAQVTLPKIFSDNMVFQRNVLIPVWGQADANEKITVRFHNQTKSTKSDKNGKWTVRLDNEIAGGPYQLTVKAKNTIQINNVLVGEVWLCSGQSNMEWSVEQSLNAKKEIATANNPFIRQIKISKEINSLPQNDFGSGTWQVCDSITVRKFTGAGYFFAKKIYEELKIPIGLINVSWAGTNIETWISREGFEGSEEYKEMIDGMPKISLDSLTKLNVSSFGKNIEILQGSKLSEANTGSFKELGFDDSRWLEFNEPEIWEKQSLGEFDGVVWLRKSIVLSAEDSKKTALLELSKIDDEDITYVNGIKVGGMAQWDASRKYSIPNGVLREGKNTIAIRVVDNGGGGGIYGDSSDLKLTLENTSIPLNGKWKFQVEALKSDINENAFPSLAYNAMINPLIPFAFQGVLWYQGESNSNRSYQYRKAFPLLINDWRQKWNHGNFPFYFVQLATFSTSGNSNEGCAWAELREAQTLTLQVPNTGMVVTTDIGDTKSIHPLNKQDLGKRLATLALKNVYKKEIVCAGPFYKSMEIKGNQIMLSFDNLGTGLTTSDQYGYIKGFEIAGKDQVFYCAKAFIKDNKVILFSENVENPIAVHFGWVGDASDNNLFNKEGFPAIPFRTDDWKTITKEAKYSFEKLK
ncbi:sialate O-acetylesterase [Flavobacterium psychrotolerans]|uniref:Sialate O-acetylesterase domain-containing protein n=1 Tax=Flavobacterium psychrotolerans TaxID=2169410 RepID=A0A2U1JG51_9FLAO|nr:sialate O-acetylesterase [Flavobacterium psychrotolerans]PWA03979.1 hypothetical protein DB895_13390 [Flavobacterium psychrotolerans]